MEVDVNTPITATAEVKKYTLVGDDIVFKQYEVSEIPTWYRNILEEVIANSATVSTLESTMRYLNSLPAGYNKAITALQSQNTAMGLSIESLVSKTDLYTAAIAALQSTKVDALSAAAIAQSTIAAYFNDGSAGGWFNSQISTYATAIQANASNISTLGVSLLGQEVRIDSIEQAAIDASGWSASASKLITGPDGSITGWQFADGSNTTSEFNIYADSFKVSDGINSYPVFSIENGVVHIGQVDTSAPQITYIGSYSSAPTATAVNQVYKNTSDGNSYIWNGSSWVLWLEKGAVGATGADGPRGAFTVTVTDGTTPSSANAESKFSAVFPALTYGRRLADKVVFQGTSSSAGKEYYRTADNSTTWTDVSLYVDGNLLVNGSIYGDKLAANTITADKLYATALSTAKFYCSDTNSEGYATFRGYFTTALSAVACGGVKTSGFGQGIYGRYDGTTSGSSGVQGITNVSGAYGVYGINSTSLSGATGIYGVGNYAIVAGNTGAFGFWTAGQCWFENAAYPFTGAHMCLSISLPQVGDIVAARDAYHLTINNNVPFVDATTTEKDKKVIGVYNGTTRNINEAAKMSGTLGEAIYDENGNEIGRKIKDEFVSIVDDLSMNYNYIGVNALGEGGINVCGLGGNIEAGDYICSSAMAGKGMKQDDDILHNYTVAKSLENVVFDYPEQMKMIACTYHCG